MAITQLQHHYAQISTDIINGAITRYQQLKQCRNETATSYMRRFDLVVDDCRQLRKNFEDDELLARLMNGLDTESKVYESRIEAIRSEKNMAKKNPTLEQVTLQSVQSQLLSLDEEKD
jgi:Retrotransposon gag protein